jgi:hypothetical protein
MAYERSGVPLPQPVPYEFASLPEHVVDNVADFYMFLGQYALITYKISSSSSFYSFEST